ncbi:hypothetical protein FVE85_9065 [Porphyridium purpureum]|uniref:Glycosyltransferase 61 catalytic domain-containing protein n=1 Tax=Porphyridium purpureum TaxID=35688 RepID=A0A5J4YPY0_PORPP|nr:hypothetical protein FVE85_9065 [Porphyridium purpureum]|eukprot:POR0461..scf222_8
MRRIALEAILFLVFGVLAWNLPTYVFRALSAPTLSTIIAPKTSGYASAFDWVSRTGLLQDGRSGFRLHARLGGNVSASYTDHIRRWGPIVLNRCQSWMPRNWAPCLYEEHPGFYGEQLLFPDFQLTLPHFTRDTQQHRADWVANAKMSPRIWWAHADVQWASGLVLYRGFWFAQNLVFLNGRTPPELQQAANRRQFDGPRAERASCFVSNQQDHDMFWSPYQTSAPRGGADEAKERENRVAHLIVAHTADFDSWQHFTDHVAHILIQNWHLRANRRVRAMLMGAPRQTHRIALDEKGSQRNQTNTSAVSELATRLGFPANLRVFPQAGVVARELVYSCRSVDVHPFFVWRFRELAMSASERDPPSEPRQTVVYFSRAAVNTRRVLNEASEVLPALRRVLEERGRNETLVVIKDPLSLTAGIALMRRAACVIGPHGGALYWIRYGVPGATTCVIELIPLSRFRIMFWETATILGMSYYALTFHSEGSRHALSVSIPDLLTTVSHALDARLAALYRRA